MARPLSISCSACLHPRKLEVDAWLRAGKGDLPTSRAFPPLSKDAVRRHRLNGHVPQMPPPPPSALAGAPGASPTEVARRIVDALNGVDVSKLSPAAQAQHFATLLRATETLERITPTPPPPPVAPAEVRRLLAYQHAMVEALEPFPEARKAVAEAVRALLASEGLA